MHLPNQKDINQWFTEYRFDQCEPSEAEGAGEAVAGASTICYPVLERSYELPARWYLVVFKPYDRAYTKNPEWFQVKGIERCRKWLKKPHAYIFTRETDASKTHINAIVCSSDDLLKKHDADLANKYKLHVQLLPERADRENAYRYIFKEERQRPFVRYLDYLYYNR